MCLRAGRTMPWYLLGVAGMTNWFDMIGTMIITSFLYMLGPRGLQSLQMGIMITLRWPMMIAFAVMGIYLVNKMYPDPGAGSAGSDPDRAARGTRRPGVHYILSARELG